MPMLPLLLLLVASAGAMSVGPPPIHCDPSAKPPEMCPGGVACPASGVCPSGPTPPTPPAPTPPPPAPTPPTPPAPTPPTPPAPTPTPLAPTPPTPPAPTPPTPPAPTPPPPAPTPPTPPAPAPSPGAGCTAVTALEEGPGGLRDCLSKVTAGQTATVAMAAGTHVVTDGLISLAAGATVTLTGAAAGTTVDGTANFDSQYEPKAKQERERLFFVSNTSTLNVHGITFNGWTHGSQYRNENSTLPWAPMDHSGGWAAVTMPGSSITATNCTFSKCTAEGSYRVKGGVVHIDSGAVSFSGCKFVDVNLGWIMGMASVAYNRGGALTLDTCDLSEAGRPDTGEQQSQKTTQHVYLDGKNATVMLKGMELLKDLRCLGGDDGKRPPYNASGPPCSAAVNACKYNCSATQVAIKLTGGASAANIHQTIRAHETAE
eukprot:SAG11_NODE_501_length_8895_cov_12.129832_1_plen_431_part_00